MSPSARRLSSTVLTNRFAWQGSAPAEPPAVVAAFPSSPLPDPGTVTPAMRDLPSPTAERLDAIEREAYARGCADGQRTAAEEAARQLEDISARLADSIKTLTGLRASVMRRSERDVVRLAISMAERILRREVDVDRGALVSMAHVAIERLGESAAATIHLNPVDHELVTARYLPDPGGSVEMVSDPAVARGACLVRSPFGTIETGIDAQIGELSKALLGDQTEAEGADFDGSGPGA